MEVRSVAVPGYQQLAVIDDVINEPPLVLRHRVLYDYNQPGFGSLMNVAIFVQSGDRLSHLAVRVVGCCGLHLEKVMLAVDRSR